MERNIKVSYYKEIWNLNEQINESLFTRYKEYHPKQKILISLNGVTKNVEVDKISIVDSVKQKTPG